MSQRQLKESISPGTWQGEEDNVSSTRKHAAQFIASYDPVTAYPILTTQPEYSSKDNLMRLFDIFASEPKKFVTHEEFRKNVQNQTTMTPQTMAQLRKLNVTSETELKLEFFFYTNAPAKAAALATALSTKQYQVEHGPSASDKKLQVIRGWTNKMPMHDSTVLAWTSEMCQVGFAHDCDFDGWGTNPSQ